MNKLIVKNPHILNGDPTIKGTRIPVSIIKSLHRGQEPISVIAHIYNITEEQVKAAINYEN